MASDDFAAYACILVIAGHRAPKAQTDVCATTGTRRVSLRTIQRCHIHEDVTQRSYNLSVPPISPTLFRRLSLWLISLLMGLLALGPFLHAHYGASWTTGFHIYGVPSSLSAALPQWVSDGPVLSVPSEEESPAVGVETSLPRAEADSFSPDAPVLLLLTGMLLLALQRLPLAGAWMPGAPPGLHTTFQAGWPPPAHAPPLAP